MNKRIYLFFLLFIISLSAAGLLFFALDKDNGQKSSEKIVSPNQSMLHWAEPNNVEFYDTVYSFARKKINLEEKKTIAGVVPHHLLAGDMIAEFYDNLAGFDFDTIVLIGPNHYNAGKSKIISSAYDWQTPYGKLECDRELLNGLDSQVIHVGLEPRVVQREHALNSQAGFIKKTFPRARFAPLILSPSLNENESIALAKALLVLDKHRKILLIASVDFSHYKDNSTAVKHDQASIEVMRKFDFRDVYALDIDSPPSIYTLMKYSEAKGANFRLLRNSNSALLSNKTEIPSTTSYVTGYFTEEKIRALFFGDLMLDRYVKDKIDKSGFDYLFEKLDEADFFNNYDIISANLEGAVTNMGEHYLPQMSYDFAFKPELVNNLHNYGFNFFTIANNHLGDQGKRGISETRDNLESMDFEYAGCGDSIVSSCNIKLLSVKNKDIGMIAVSTVYAELNEEKLEKLITEQKKLVDIIIVNIHWGVEYERKYNIGQQDLAHKMIDAGADVIIGHHPHVIQGMEIYHGKPIFYSLGNFIFDQYFSKETQEGLALEFDLDEDIMSILLYPIKANQSQVRLMDDDEKKAVFEEIIKYSSLDKIYEEQIRNGQIWLNPIL